MYGKQGQEWLQSLPIVIERFAKNYQIISLKPVPNMSFNYVATGLHQEKKIVLKFGINNNDLSKEAACLKAFNGYGVPKVIASEKYLLIMEQATPGTPLKTYFPSQEEQSVIAASELMKNLHKAPLPKTHGFYHIKDLLQSLEASTSIPVKIINKARLLRDKLLAIPIDEVLLHGDLHHDNILKNNNSWLAIDPKGFIGDPAFDCSAFISNPIPELLQQKDPKSLILNRIEQFSEILNIPKQRIYDWHYVKTVLCWVWCIEDNLNAIHFEQILELMD